MNTLKKMIIKDSQTFKKIVDLFYVSEVYAILNIRTEIYNKIVLNGLEIETKLHLNDIMRDFIYLNISEVDLKSKIGKILK